jgi:hypothetical protein
MTDPAKNDITPGPSNASRPRASDARAERELPRLCYSVDDVCKITGLGRTTIYAAFKSGALIKTKIFGRTAVLDEDLMAFLRNSRISPAPKSIPPRRDNSC